MNSLYNKIHPALPIYKILFKDSSVYYTPGKIGVFKKKESVYIDELIQNNKKSSEGKVNELIEHAQNTVSKWNTYLNEPFIPECLTIYLSYSCNLNCSYCFSKKDINLYKKNDDVIDIEAVCTAAEYVAQKCAENNRVFVLVVHGGGEPTYHWKLLVDIFNRVKTIADSFELNFFSYVATNGIMNENIAEWLSKHFNLIGLSCDGPPDIQGLHRNPKSGLDCSYTLERTVNNIYENGGCMNVRATITKETIDKQEEIVIYLAKKLRIKKIRFEPEYLSVDNKFTIEEAKIFVRHFLNARKLAYKENSNLSYAGIRLDEIHGPYCDVFRNTLRLLPNGKFTNCFCETQEPFSAIELGNSDSVKTGTVLEYRSNNLKQKAILFNEICIECINQYHCSRGCPDYCFLSGKSDNLDIFKCRLHNLLAVELILESSFSRI